MRYPKKSTVAIEHADENACTPNDINEHSSCGEHNRGGMLIETNCRKERNDKTQKQKTKKNKSRKFIRIFGKLIYKSQLIS